MRSRKTPEFKWRRRAGLFTCLIMGSVMGWWVRDLSRAQPPAAYAWIKTARDDQDGFFSARWRRVNEDGLRQVQDSEYLYWITPSGAEVVPGPAQRRAPAAVAKDDHPLWASRQAIRAMSLPPADAAQGRVTVLSPVGVTRYRNPIVDWVATPGTQYDVAVIDAEDPMAPPRLLRNARPPLPLLSLETTEPRPLRPGRIYEVYIREAGKDVTLGGASVLVSEDSEDEYRPVAPGLALFEAATALRARPYRTGDAWVRLSALPPGWAATDLAKRTRLAVALELGLPDVAKQARQELLK